MVRVYISSDSSSRAIGTRDVQAALIRAAADRDINLDIVPTGSRGLYWLEPMVEVETADGRIAYGPLDADDVGDLVDGGMLDGANSQSCLGRIEDMMQWKVQDRLTFARCGLIDRLSLSDYEAHGGLAGLRAAIKLSGQEIIDMVKTSGLRGRGGAGFPTGIKWQTVHDCTADQKYIVCNADEGDSGTFADRMLMEGDPFILIEGMAIAALAVGATKGFIYCRSEYPDAIEVTGKAIKIAEENGVLGDDVLGSGKAFHLEMRVGAGAYICGEETSLLESLEGKRGMIRFKPPLPAIEGLFGKPTIVNNMVSLATIPVILSHGGEYYRDFGVGKSRGTLTVQLSGNVARPGLYEIDFGRSLRQVIDLLGGGTASKRPVRAVQVGGPLGAYIPEDQLDVILDYEEMAKIGAMLGHGGIVVFDDTVDMQAQARFAMEFCSVESCGKCTPCRIGSTRGVEVIDKIAAAADPTAEIELLEELCDVMTHGSLCAMGGLTPAPVMSALKHFRGDFTKSSPASTPARAKEAIQ